MSKTQTHHFSKTLLVFLLGLPFVIGVFSNTRPAVPDYSHANAVIETKKLSTSKQNYLFSHIAAIRKSA